MRHLLSNLKELSGKLTKCKLFLFLDYDGTLTRLVSHPEEASLSREKKMFLKRLASAPGIQMALVSGRSLKDLRGLFSAPGIFYAGNHGLEIKGPGISFMHPRARQLRPRLKRLKRLLENQLRPFAGICVEDKGFSLSIHYRNCHSRRWVKKAKAVFLKLFIESGMKDKFRINSGKKVWEIKPDALWNKGSAVRLLEKKMGRGYLPIFIGDDLTDEDAFAAIGERGLSILTGRPIRASAAGYFLKSPSEVFKFLGRLLSLKRH